MRVISIRAQDPGDLVTNAATVYINNAQVISTPQLNISTETFQSAGDLRIGGEIALQGNQYTGYLADFIIFNTIHDETTHFWVTEYLKTRWNIT